MVHIKNMDFMGCSKISTGRRESKDGIEGLFLFFSYVNLMGSDLDYMKIQENYLFQE